ncbi:SDR family NAD(P)-dependent oxidoreductase [Amycolatopsis endophytica]
MLTGVSRGLGHEAAKVLMARRPHDHYVVLARGDAARAAETLGQATGADRVVGVSCDLGSLADVNRAAGMVTAGVDAGRLPPLGGFLGNAGVVFLTTDTRTADGYEATFAINVLAHQLLIRLLMPRFVAPAWVVLTTSDSHFGQFRYTLGATPPPRWAAPAELATPRHGGPQAAGRAYATSKLGTIYLTHALARRLPPGVGAHSYNPALVAGTDFFRAAPQPLRAVMQGFFRLQLALGRGMTAERAGRRLAETILAGMPGPSGGYVDRGRAVPSSPESYDEGREEELWREGARLCG